MKKITKLTKEQEEKLAIYEAKGNQIGLAVGAEFDEKEVRELTDKHRELCGIPKATNFIVFDSPMAACKEYDFLKPSNALYGQHDIHWLIQAMFFREECGLVEETNDMVYLYELAQRVGWMWMSSDTTVVTRRPTRLSMVKDGDHLVLHDLEKQAIEYADGEGGYYVRGVEVSEIFKELEGLTVEDLAIEMTGDDSIRREIATHLSKIKSRK